MKKIVLAGSSVILASVAGYFVAVTYAQNQAELKIEDVLKSLPKDIESSYSKIDTSLASNGVRVSDLVIKSEKGSVKFANIDFYGGKKDGDINSFTRVEAKDIKVNYSSSVKIGGKSTDVKTAVTYEIPTFYADNISLKDGVVTSYVKSLEVFEKFSADNKNHFKPEIFANMSAMMSNMANGISFDKVVYSNAKYDFEVTGIENVKGSCVVDGDITTSNWKNGNVEEQTLANLNCDINLPNDTTAKLSSSEFKISGMNMNNFAKIYSTSDSDNDYLDVIKGFEVNNFSIKADFDKERLVPFEFKLAKASGQDMKARAGLGKVMTLMSNQKAENIEQEILSLMLDFAQAKQITYSGLEVSAGHKRNPFSLNLSKFQIDDMKGFTTIGNLLISELSGKVMGQDYKLDKFNLANLDLTDFIKDLAAAFNSRKKSNEDEIIGAVITAIYKKPLLTSIDIEGVLIPSPIGQLKLAKYEGKAEFFEDTGFASSAIGNMKNLQIPTDNPFVHMMAPYFKGLKPANIALNTSYKADLDDSNEDVKIELDARELVKVGIDLSTGDMDLKSLVEHFQSSKSVTMQKFASYGEKAVLDGFGLKIENLAIVQHTLEFFANQTGMSTDDLKKQAVAMITPALKGMLNSGSADNIINGVKMFLDDPKNIEVKLKSGDSLPIGNLIGGKNPQEAMPAIMSRLRNLNFEVNVNQ